jgi:hypothetical protein
METEENGILGECNSDEFLSTGTIRINTALMENGQLLTGDSIITSGSTSTWASYNRNDWTEPNLVEVDEGKNYLALTYTEDRVSNFYNGTSGSVESRRVYKVIYSCIGGKWHKSEKIYGKIVPPTKETYTDFVVELDKII